MTTPKYLQSLDQERLRIQTLLSSYPILLLQGPSLTGVVRTVEVLTELHFAGQESYINPILKGENPDILIYDGRELKVDEMRTLRQEATSSPGYLTRKYLIISYIEKPHHTALPVLLKLIEEPPPDFSMVLTTNRPEKILPTIHSRSLSFSVRPSGEKEISWWLKFKNIDHDNLRISSCLGDFNIAEKMDMSLISFWNQAWFKFTKGEVLDESFPEVWTENFEDANEETQMACWGLFLRYLVPSLPAHLHWRELASLATACRNKTEMGEMNKLAVQTALLRVYALAKTIRVRSE